jgi:branched-chain amino acid transport system substrate-binding protein
LWSDCAFIRKPFYQFRAKQLISKEKTMHHRTVLFTLAILMALFLVACAPAQPAAEPAAEAPGEQAAQDAPTEAASADTEFSYSDEWGVVVVEAGEAIRLGFVAGLSGAGIDVLGIDEQRGAELAVKDNPEVLGFPVELQIEDGQCNAEGGQTVATKLVANPEIVGVVGHMCSSGCTPAADIYQQNNYSMVSPSCTAPSLTEPSQRKTSFFRTAWNDSIQGPAAAGFVYDTLGVRKVATIHDGSPYAEQLVQEFSKAFEAAGGEIVATEAVNVGDTDMRPVLTRINASEPELIYWGGFVAEGAFLTAQRADVGMEDVIIMGADGIRANAYIEAASGAAEGSYASAASAEAAGPNMEQFLADYAETYGEDPIAPFHAHAYDAARLLMHAIEQVAQVDPEGNLHIGRKALNEALANTQDFPGLTGSLTCNEFGDCGVGNVAISQVQDGEWVEISQ